MEIMTWHLFERACQFLKIKIMDYGVDSIYGVPRGGMVVAVELSHLLSLPIVEKPKKTTLIVDDICDSGKTLEKYCRKNYITAVLYYNKNAIIRPTMWALTKHEFVKFPWETNDSAKIDYTCQ